VHTLATGKNKNCPLRKAIRIILYQLWGFLSTIILQFFAFFSLAASPTASGTILGQIWVKMPHFGHFGEPNTPPKTKKCPKMFIFLFFCCDILLDGEN